MKLSSLLVCGLFLSFSAQSAVFNGDDRLERYQIKDSLVLNSAISSAALVPKVNIKIDKNEVIEVSKRTLNSTYGFCSDANFSDQLMLANCSAALIGEDLILTAGHCLDDKMDFGCDDYHVVFDYARIGNQKVKLRKENIYNCKEVIHYEFDFMSGSWIDLAIIKLDRKVRDREPIKVETRKIEVGEELFMIGHPLGLPQKVSKEGVVTRNDRNSDSFEHNLDTFSCNSGGPVFSKKTGNIIGVLVRGSGANFEKRGNCQDWYKAKSNDFSESNDLISLESVLRNIL